MGVILGFCRHDGRVVRDEECLTCYLDQQTGKREALRPFPRLRMRCVDANVTDAPVEAVREG